MSKKDMGKAVDLIHATIKEILIECDDRKINEIVEMLRTIQQLCIIWDLVEYTEIPDMIEGVNNFLAHINSRYYVVMDEKIKLFKEV